MFFLLIYTYARYRQVLLGSVYQHLVESDKNSTDKASIIKLGTNVPNG